MSLVLHDPEPLVCHEEPICRDGELVGYVTSGAFGHTLGRAVALGWVEHRDGVGRDFLESGRWEVDIALTRHRVRPSLRPPYDPKGERMRG